MKNEPKNPPADTSPQEELPPVAKLPAEQAPATTVNEPQTELEGTETGEEKEPTALAAVESIDILATKDILIHRQVGQIPEMRKTEWKDFLNDVQSVGVRDPALVRRKGSEYECFDGRHRLRAALELGKLTIPARIMDVGDEEVAEIIYAAAVHRRHLTDDQRAMLATHWIKIRGKEAKKARGQKGGQAAGRGRPMQTNSLQDTSSQELSQEQPAEVHAPASDSLQDTVSGKLSSDKQPKKSTRQQAAEEFGVSERKLKDAMNLVKNAPEVAARVLAGQLKLRAAIRLVDKVAHIPSNACGSKLECLGDEYVGYGVVVKNAVYVVDKGHYEMAEVLIAGVGKRVARDLCVALADKLWMTRPYRRKKPGTKRVQNPKTSAKAPTADPPPAAAVPEQEPGQATAASSTTEVAAPQSG
jgi:hypothetical protein